MKLLLLLHLLLDCTSISLADYLIEVQTSETMPNVTDKNDLVFQKDLKEYLIDEAIRSTNQILGIEKKQSINRRQNRRNGWQQKPTSTKKTSKVQM